jgi:hypothetical protein
VKVECKFVFVFYYFSNVISVSNQVANVHSQHAPEEVLHQQQEQQQTGSSAQILILLPDGNQQLVNFNVPQSCSLKEILEQVMFSIVCRCLKKPTNSTNTIIM